MSEGAGRTEDGPCLARPLHATAVELEGRGLLILGPPGAGKSALALDLIALGARLVSDDVVLVRRRGRALVASAPETAAAAPPNTVAPSVALIEARGIGMLRTPAAGPTPLALAIDLGRGAEERLPPTQAWRHDGVSLPLIARPDLLQPAAVRAALLCGGPLDPDAPLALASGLPADQGSLGRADSAHRGVPRNRQGCSGCSA